MKSIWWLIVLTGCIGTHPVSYAEPIRQPPLQGHAAEVMSKDPGRAILQHWYEMARSVAPRPATIDAAYRQWARSTLARCKDDWCISAALRDEAGRMGRRYVEHMRVRDDEPEEFEAQQLCQGLSDLASAGDLSNYSLPADPDTSLDEATQNKLSEHPDVFSGYAGVHWMKLSQRGRLHRVGTFSVGGSCASTQVHDIDLLLAHPTESVSPLSLNLPESALEQYGFGDIETPVVFRRRSLIWQGSWVWWLRPDGRRHTLCRIAWQDTRRQLMQSHNDHVCNAVVNGDAQPQGTWSPAITPSTVAAEVKQHFARAESGAAFTTFLSAGRRTAGTFASLASGAGCGAEFVWFAPLVPGTEQIAEQHPLKTIIRPEGAGTLDVYNIGAQSFALHDQQLLYPLDNPDPEAPLCRFKSVNRSRVAEVFVSWDKAQTQRQRMLELLEARRIQKLKELQGSEREWHEKSWPQNRTQILTGCGLTATKVEELGEIFKRASRSQASYECVRQAWSNSLPDDAAAQDSSSSGHSTQTQLSGRRYAEWTIDLSKVRPPFDAILSIDFGRSRLSLPFERMPLVSTSRSSTNADDRQVVGLALDLDKGEARWQRNGQWEGGTDVVGPASLWQTEPGLEASIFWSLRSRQGQWSEAVSVNFGDRAFENPPNGYIGFDEPVWFTSPDRPQLRFAVAEPSRRQFGQYDFNHWLQAYWDWLGEFNAGRSPSEDSTGALCRRWQRDEGMFFLTGSSSSEPVTRRCAVPKNRPILLPIINVSGRAASQNVSCETLEASVTPIHGSAEDLYLKINGRSVDQSTLRSSSTGCFQARNPWPLSEKEGSSLVVGVSRITFGRDRSLLFGAGHWVVVTFGDSGHYDLEFGGRYQADGFSQKVRYLLDVK